MKLKKIAALLTAAVSASALAVSASATLKVAENPDPGLTPSTGMFLCQVYNKGNPDENKPATDYGVDLTKIAKVSVTFSPVDKDEWFTGATGGGVILSINGGDITNPSDLWDKYNWPQQSFWGVNDEAIAINTQNVDDVLLSEKVGDYTYKLTSNVFANPFNDDGVKDVDCVQVAFSEWGADTTDIEVLQLDVLDADGNVLISFDKNGVATVGGAAAPAPAEAAPADTVAPAAGDVDAATSSTKGSPDTGVADVAVVAGLAIVAAGAVVVSKKRK